TGAERTGSAAGARTTGGLVSSTGAGALTGAGRRVTSGAGGAGGLKLTKVSRGFRFLSSCEIALRHLVLSETFRAKAFPGSWQRKTFQGPLQVTTLSMPAARVQALREAGLAYPSCSGWEREYRPEEIPSCRPAESSCWGA